MVDLVVYYHTIYVMVQMQNQAVCHLGVKLGVVRTDVNKND